MRCNPDVFLFIVFSFQKLVLKNKNVSACLFLFSKYTQKGKISKVLFPFLFPIDFFYLFIFLQKTGKRKSTNVFNSLIL